MSKELTPLEALKSFLGTRGWYDDEFQRRYDFVEKSLKALEIIKKKMVNVEDLIDAIYEDSYHQNNEHNAIDIYNENRFEYKQLTQEEIDLLKEVLL